MHVIGQPQSVSVDTATGAGVGGGTGGTGGGPGGGSVGLVSLHFLGSQPSPQIEGNSVLTL